MEISDIIILMMGMLLPEGFASSQEITDALSIRNVGNLRSDVV